MSFPAELQTREQFTAAYDNSAAVPDAAEVLASLRGRSEAFHEAHACAVDVAYGDQPRQVYDWYAAGRADAAAPVLVFLHGGYWQARTRREFCCVAAGAREAGMHVVLGEYTLAPQARLGDMVAEVGMLLDALDAHPVLGRAGADAPPRVVLCGHSAGAHLAVMHRHHPALAGVVAISGLFDLEPIRRGALNDALRLDSDEARACSPLHRIGPGAPTLVAVGDAELPELQRQSLVYADALRAAGERVRLLRVAQANHFTILAQLESREGTLLAAAIELAMG